MLNIEQQADTLGTSGVLAVWSCPGVLTKHVEWVAARVLGSVVSMVWRPQPLQPGTFFARLEWGGPIGTASEIASGLHGWKQLRFEISEQQTAQSAAGIWMHTPSLGIHHAQVDILGNQLLTEHQLSSIVAQAAGDPATYAHELRLALGSTWNEELDAFRASALEAQEPAHLRRVPGLRTS